MVVPPLVVRIASTSVILSVFAAITPAHAQADGRTAQIVVDADTNEVLYENNAQAARRPASITKVMTLYLLFDALKQGSLNWNDRIVFSRNAANQPPTKLFVRAGNSIPVQTAVEALVLRSANDVATAVAESIGGSEAGFARMMTEKARQLGMSSTTFMNASGLPSSTQRTTAEDLARLAIAIRRDFPDQYHWFSAREMTYAGQTITGHNHLMKRMPGMDGLKTGYTRASGFNLAATTQRDGRRIVTVVLGGENRFQRDDLVEALTESAYRELGIGGNQFATNTTAYEVNFRDSRDAADAAALVMDLPLRTETTSDVATIAMARSGRRLNFSRSAPTFFVADMTRATSRQAAAAARQEDDDRSASDEDDENSGAAPSNVPVRMAMVTTNRANPALALERGLQTSPPPPRPVSVAAATRVITPSNGTTVSPLRGSVISLTARPEVEPIPAPEARSTQVAELPSQVAVSSMRVAQASPPDAATTSNIDIARQDAAALSSRSSELLATSEVAPLDGELNGKVNFAEGATLSVASEMADDTAPVEEAQNIQMADLNAQAVERAQRLQAEASARVQARIDDAQALEDSRRALAREQAAAVLRATEARERRTAEREMAEARVIEARAKATKDKEARETAIADRAAATAARAVAARQERARQAQAATERAQNARGNAIVQVGAFRSQDDATAALAQFENFFPSFARREVTSVTSSSGIWYRARFGGLGGIAAREACRLVLGRGGACQIMSGD